MSDGEISVKTIDHPGLDPVEAFARLRSYTPERAGFLLESLGQDAEAGRYSILGYRVRRYEGMAPGVDVEGELRSVEGRPGPETLAEALCTGSVGHVAGDAVARIHGVRLHQDTGQSGAFLTDTTVMVYDHPAGKVHIAGRVKGKAVERCIWELEHGPPRSPLEARAEARPKTVNRRVGDKRIAARAGRVQSFFGDELESAVLAEELTTPLLQADPFDIYCALRELEPASHGFFLDYGQAPVGGWMRHIGLSRTSLHLKRPGGEGQGWEALRAALPHPLCFGTPPITAARVLRDIEDGARTLLGDAVGYVCPGGESAWVLAEQCIMVYDTHVVCSVGAPVSATTEPDSVNAAVEAAARPLLAAIESAHARQETTQTAPG